MRRLLLPRNWRPSATAPAPDAMIGTPLEPFMPLFARANADELPEPLRRCVVNSAHNYGVFTRLGRLDLMAWELERLARWEAEAAQLSEEREAA